jgi:hypothetical protein
MQSFRSFGRVTLQSAILAAATLVASESIVLAQNEPPAGGQGEGRQRGDGAQRGGGRGFGGGGMGRMMGGGGMGRGMQDVREALEADFQRRDIPIFVRQLKLTEDQGVVLETLFVEYESTFQPEAEGIMTSMAEMGRNLMRAFASPERQQQMRETMEKIQQEVRDAEAANGPMDEEARRAFFRERMQKAAEQFATEAQNSGLDAEMKAAMGEMLSKLESWQGRKAQLRDSFAAGLKAVLDDDQVAQWPAFERFLTREKTLPRGRISGENVNLFLVVDELRLPPEEFAKIEPMFDEYEARLDTALRARNTYIEESLPRLFKAIQEGDVDAAKRIFKQHACGRPRRERRVPLGDGGRARRERLGTATRQGRADRRLGAGLPTDPDGPHVRGSTQDRGARRGRRPVDHGTARAVPQRDRPDQRAHQGPQPQRRSRAHRARRRALRLHDVAGHLRHGAQLRGGRSDGRRRGRRSGAAGLRRAFWRRRAVPGAAEGAVDA